MAQRHKVKNNMDKTYSFKVEENEAGRLDKFLSFKLPDYSRTSIQKLIVSGNVWIEYANGSGGKKEHLSSHLKLSGGQIICIMIPGKTPLPDIDEEARKLIQTLYEDDNVLVINKPVGIVVHGAGATFAKKEQKSIVSLLWPELSHKEWPDINRPGIVHRLDKDTSGALIIAKTPEILFKIAGQFAARSVKKMYYALIWGHTQLKEGSIEGPVGRSSTRTVKFEISPGGRWSKTGYRIIERFPESALWPQSSFAEITPYTGRTHQIRVQLAAIGHPVIGDKVYAPKHKAESLLLGAKRQMLHSYKIEFTYPVPPKTGEKITVTAPLPDDFMEILRKLRPPLKETGK